MRPDWKRQRAMTSLDHSDSRVRRNRAALFIAGGGERQHGTDVDVWGGGRDAEREKRHASVSYTSLGDDG